MRHFIQGVILKGLFESGFSRLNMYINGYLRGKMGIKRERRQVKNFTN